MARDHYEEFWEHVRRHLQHDHGLSEPGARKAQEQYRERMVSHDAIGVVYHWMPAEVAEAISGGGYQKPYSKREGSDRAACFSTEAFP